MHILVTGLNHRTAPVEMRERFSIAEESLPEALLQLKNTKTVKECVIVSTCNRLELYTVVDRQHLCGPYIKGFLENWFGSEREDFVPYLYMYENDDAVRHLFKVASGLDSMIIGETQILGQVRNAFLTAQKYRTTDTVFNTLFKQAVTMAKKAHVETTINENAVSISYAAVELSKQHLGQIDEKTVLIIGAGKTGELTVKHLLSSGAKRLIVANRTVSRAKELSTNYDGEYCTMDELESKLTEADIVISSTGAPGIMLTKSQVETAMQQRRGTGRPLLMIDIAVPRDLDPQINQLPGVTLYDIDDLEGIIESNFDQRREAALEIEAMIETELDAFHTWQKTAAAGPVIRALQEKSNRIHEEVMTSLFNKLPDLGDREEKLIRKLSKSIVNQLLQDPIESLKEMSTGSEREEALRMFSQLFNLEQQLQSSASSNKVEMLFNKTSRKKIVSEEPSVSRISTGN